ncbi:hypothetical protein FRX31_008870 [Thalictrum thalictroides]|uniref:Transmembrane protein n=1 Tax=Thalictrum thalictroides TaxID=46969 RepID=A0A7J6WVU5_THATH|nr:hypothetical protein FRX31_008870 [Thalictrum thalictroides]
MKTKELVKLVGFLIVVILTCVVEKVHLAKVLRLLFIALFLIIPSANVVDVLVSKDKSTKRLIHKFGLTIDFVDMIFVASIMTLEIIKFFDEKCSKTNVFKTITSVDHFGLALLGLIHMIIIAREWCNDMPEDTTNNMELRQWELEDQLYIALTERDIARREVMIAYGRCSSRRTQENGGSHRRGGVWDLRLRRNRFEWEDEHFRHLMTLLTGYVVEDGEDMWRWKEGKHGVFSVRSMYKLLREQSSMHNQVTNVIFPASLIWNQNMPAKIMECTYLLNCIS